MNDGTKANSLLNSTGKQRFLRLSSYCSISFLHREPLVPWKKSTTLPTVKWRLPLTQISSPVKKGENEPKRGRRRGCTTRPEFNRFQLCSTYSRPVLAWIALGLVVVVNTLTNRSISESLIVPDCGWFLLENPKCKRVSVYYVPASLSPRQPKLNGRNRRRSHWPFSASELTEKEMDKSGGLSIQN